jgi:hypothetical protein
MKEATDVSSADDVPASVRKLRDDYMDQSMIGNREPLTFANVGNSGFSEGSTYGEQPEFPILPARAVLIGRFESFRSVLNASRRVIYTEVHVKPSHIFEDVGGGARANADITILLAGGTVHDSNGDVLSYLTQPRHYSIAPGKTYLLVLDYQPVGDFYRFGKDWDLSDGTARADNAVEVRRLGNGNSTIVGLSAKDLVGALDKRFSVIHQ